jgi:hypothetical protein
MNVKAFRVIALTGLAFGTAAPVARGAVVDFETFNTATDNDLANNFRVFQVNGGVPTNSNNGAAVNDVITVPAPSAFGVIYDATPGDLLTTQSTFAVSQGNPLTVSADVTFSVNNSSFGVYIVNASNEGTASSYLALFNVNNTGGTADQLRFSSNATGNAPATVGTLVASPSTSDVFDIGATNGKNISVTYSINATNNPVLSLSVGGVEYGNTTFSSITTPLTNVEVGLRVASTGTTAGYTVDNFSAAVPEPASFSLFALAAVPVLTRRRRNFA